MGFSLQVPQVGQLNSTEDPKIVSDFATLQTWGNGNIGTTDVQSTLAQSAGINQSGQTVKGSSNISAAQTTGSTGYVTLSTPDQVAGIVLPAAGLIAVWFQAAWFTSGGTANAAIFVGSNQLKVADMTVGASPSVQGTSYASTNAAPLFSFPGGLSTSAGAGAYTGDVTTGQTVSAGNGVGGACYIFAAAGTYTISVRFLAGTGTVTAQNRKLWVQALSFV